MRKIFKRVHEEWEKMTLRQMIGLIVITTILDIVLIAILVMGIIGSVTELRREDETKVHTFAYDMKYGRSITSTLGRTIDGCHYVIDETAIFGPYSEKPALQIPIADSDIVVDTSDMSFAQDKIGGFGHGVSDCRKEQRCRLNEDTLVYAGLARYEDGEIYAYVQFLQKVENLGGSSRVSNELWSRAAENGNSLTDEERSQVDKVDEIERQGVKDYCLYAPSDLSDTATDRTVAIEYCVDHLDLVEY